MTEKKQRAKVGVAGSFINQLMSNNSTLPIVGKGATEMHYTDRTCYEVVEVSEDGKTAKLEQLEAIADLTKPCEMGHQNWILTPTGQFITVQWRHNAWRRKTEIVEYTKEFSEKQNKTQEDYDKIYTEEAFPGLALSCVVQEKNMVTQ